jgi:hypothetical protein
MADQFYFGNDMQDLLLACMLQMRSEFHVLASLVKPQFMWGMDAMRIAAAMQDYHEEQGIYPGLVAVDNYLHEKYSRDKADIYAEAHDYLEKLKKIDTKDWQWVKKVTVKFCKERALICAIKEAADLVKTDKVPEGGFTPMFDKAMSIGRDLSDLGMSFVGDAERIVLQATEKTWGIRTGYHLLDGIWRNGWGPGWLVVPLAPPKSYKSTFCVNLALNIAKKATNADMCPIFYYACEISAELTALRGYSIVAGVPLDSMYDDVPKFIAKAKRGLEKWFGIANGKYGQILMKSYAAKTATIADIRAHALAAIEAFGIRPRVIVIDHAETIKPNKTNEKERASDHRAQADIYTDARALGQELQCVVIMPDRCNKETVQQPVPNMTSFQGSFEKAGVVDVAIGLCQTDIERARNFIRYFVFMNRHGRQYDYFLGSVGADRFSMTIDEKTDYEEAVEYSKAAAKESRGTGRGGRPYKAKRLPEELEDGT